MIYKIWPQSDLDGLSSEAMVLLGPMVAPFLRNTYSQ